MPKSRPAFSNVFIESYRKCDGQMKMRIDKAVEKILLAPSLGKPLRYGLAGCRSERVGNMRIVYQEGGGVVFFHRFDQRKKVYD